MAAPSVEQLLLQVLAGVQKLSSVPAQVEHLQQDVGEVKYRLKELNGTVRENCTDIAVLKDWRLTQAQPMLAQVPAIQLDIKGLVVKYGGTVAVIGGVAAVVLFALRALGIL